MMKMMKLFLEKTLTLMKLKPLKTIVKDMVRFGENFKQIKNQSIGLCGLIVQLMVGVKG